MNTSMSLLRGQQRFTHKTTSKNTTTCSLNGSSIVNKLSVAKTLGSTSFISATSKTLRCNTSSSYRRNSRDKNYSFLVSARAKDPDAVDDDGEDEAGSNQGPPTLFWRVFSALCYLVPWIDSISLGREIYRRFRNLLVLYLVPGPLTSVYFSSQFAPLIIFFVMFLSIVKNKKLHHFVRFNCMQAIMLDIAVMLFHIIRAYLPAELKWSALSHFIDMFAWTCCMGTVVYAVFWTLRGYYADIPFVSESVYHQVALSEYA